MSLNQVLETFEKNWNRNVEDLQQLVKIPSVSFDGFPKEEVLRCSKTVAELMKSRGLENVEIISAPGSSKDSFPYVYADHLHAPGKPTLLLYAHYDVQPAGNEEKWKTQPFTPTFKDGPGGKRMYARGAADDKAGIIVHTSAISSFLEATRSLPLNVKIIIEGEEEVGSSGLFDFLNAHRKKLQADILVLTDTTNFDIGTPSLTIALRGLVGVSIEVKALTQNVHSGMWGGPLPDPAIALSKMLGGLVDEKGEIAIPGIRALIPKLSSQDEKLYESLPFDEALFRDQSGMLKNTQLLRKGPSPWAQIWRMPSISVNAMEASSRKNVSNIINSSAWARVTMRIPPGMDASKVEAELIRHLESSVPWGLELKLTKDPFAQPWFTDPKGPAFEAAFRAMEKGYKKKVVPIGCGGTIPFVAPFSSALGGAPALLIGVEDPYTNAHGENESVLLSDLKSACLSQVHLFDELSKLG